MQSISMKVFFAIVIVLVLMAPYVVLAISGVKFQRAAGGRSGWFVLVGAVLLVLSALDSIYMTVLAVLVTADELARLSLWLSYANYALTWFALTLLGIGIWMQSKVMRQALAVEHETHGGPGLSSSAQRSTAPSSSA